MQSPINIDNNSTTAANYSDFAFSIGYKTAMTGSISNTGYASMFFPELALTFVSHFLVNNCS